MNTSIHHNRREESAFTLVEVVIVTAITTMLAAIVMGSHVFGLKMASRVQVRLSASDDARQTMGRLIQDIRSAHHMRIGSGNQNSFTDASDNANQQGSALEIYFTASTNGWVRYYYNAADNSLRCTRTGATASLVSANSVTNDVVLFAKEDYLGQIYTNRIPVSVVRVKLSFTKLKNPQVSIGPGKFFDFYQIDTRITPRITL